MIIELYPNDEKFEFEHGDEHALWVNATQEQIEVLSSMDWLICSEIDGDPVHMHVDFDISDQGVGAAFNIANLMLTKIQGEVLA